MARQVRESVEHSIAVAAGYDHEKVTGGWKALDANSGPDRPLVLPGRQEAVRYDTVVQLVGRQRNEVDTCGRDETDIRHQHKNFAGSKPSPGTPIIRRALRPGRCAASRSRRVCATAAHEALAATAALATPAPAARPSTLASSHTFGRIPCNSDALRALVSRPAV